MSRLHFQLFGKFTAEKDGQTLTGLDAGKDQELLSYLLIHRDARLSDADIDLVYQWARAERKRLKAEQGHN